MAADPHTCGSVLHWAGHPTGGPMRCDLDAPHPDELHRFTWHMEDGVHSIRWSDAMADYHRAVRDA